MEITGKLIKVEEVKKFTGKSEFRVMDFVVETNEKYPQKLKLQAKDAVIEDVKSLKIGEESVFKINLRGREYNGSFFNTLECWSIGKGKKDSVKKEEAPKEEKKKENELPW